ncbi:DUF87 domain-containing protein [Halorubrum sp. AD140]|uniref:ATP-binding protein n=1 Tax=Halorubrum sp. AD140 TaxID=3050073 RepID=UPI002ACC606A|nr:DUF87 domain-containing protein [Halorubrum sp. AD140]MDZ5811758.1 DUF87 domain-containing protein [Halorubrum sp. AD140]
MTDEGPEEWIVATKGAKTLPVKELLTGRGFVSGKSGSGKSNTVSVLCEELLENNFPLLIIDTEGEYFGLKEEYELLHVGGDEFAEVQVGPEHADKIAEIALEKNLPVILDVSGYDDTDTSEDLIRRVIDEVYSREKRIRKPFLLVVEEMQEYLPQRGGAGELGELLERVAKRGRKRGLGMCGVSQRPSSVDKDYITQCDWMVWHKFTWESDLTVVSNVIGKDRAKECENFDPGEAYLMTDWDDTIERVQFRQKRTFDAGATPGLEAFERPDLKQVGQQFISEIEGDGVMSDSSTAYDASNSADEPATPDPVESPDVDPLTELSETDTDRLPVESTADSSDSLGEHVAIDLDSAELEQLDDEELVERINRVTKENLLLKDEIGDLREISDTDPNDDASPFRGGSHPAAQSKSPQPRRYGSGRRTASDDTRIEPPSRPSPPEKQDVENEAARALFEFGDLMMYLWKSVLYYILYALYKVRVWLWSVRSQQDPSQQQRGRPD